MNFEKKMLHNSPVPFYQVLSLADIAGGTVGEGELKKLHDGHDQNRRNSKDSLRWCLITYK